MILIIPFNYDHYLENFYTLRTLDSTSAHLNVPSGPAYSFFFEEKYLGSLGFSFLYEGVAIAWMVTSVHVEEHSQDFIKACWEVFNFQIEADGIWRMECKVPDIPKFITFIEHFGFKREGLAKNYGPNKEDYHHYAWLRND